MSAVLTILAPTENRYGGFCVENHWEMNSVMEILLFNKTPDQREETCSSVKLHEAWVDMIKYFSEIIAVIIRIQITILNVIKINLIRRFISIVKYSECLYHIR